MVAGLPAQLIGGNVQIGVGGERHRPSVLSISAFMFQRFFYKSCSGVGAIISLLLSLYLSTTALLLGAERNALPDGHPRQSMDSGAASGAP